MMRSRITLLCGVVSVVLLLIQPAGATTFSFADQPGITGGGDGTTILDTSDPDFGGIDDSFEGVVSYTFTSSFTQFDNGGDNTTAESTFSGFQLFNGGTENLGINDMWSSANWSYFRAADTEGDGELDNGSGPLPIALNDPQTFAVAINYMAGGDDSAVITWNGNANVLPTGNYSFDNVRVRAGNGLTAVDFTDMSMTINAVPEPSTCVLAIVALLAVAVCRRRRLA
jgi:hypothetical protein